MSEATSNSETATPDAEAKKAEKPSNKVDVSNAKVTVLAEDIHMDYRVTLDNNNGGGRRRIQFGRKKTNFQALRGISVFACEGEFIGLIGRNGSGKSTLLRVLAGLESPTKGTVMTSAKPQLLGVSAALQPNLSGLDNIRLGLLAMGLTPEEAEERRERIVKFADIGDSIRMPMRAYSSGMGARLRFAISVAAEPEILMIDEALSTGDSAFLERSQEAMQSLMKRSGTGFLVNHSSSAITRMCSRAIWLDRGEVIADGDPARVVHDYEVFARAVARGRPESAAGIRAAQLELLQERNYRPDNH